MWISGSVMWAGIKNDTDTHRMEKTLVWKDHSLQKHQNSEKVTKIVMFRLSNTRSQHTIQEVTSYLLSSKWHLQVSQSPLPLLEPGQLSHFNKRTNTKNIPNSMMTHKQRAQLFNIFFAVCDPEMEDSFVNCCWVSWSWLNFGRLNFVLNDRRD